MTDLGCVRAITLALVWSGTSIPKPKASFTFVSGTNIHTHIYTHTHAHMVDRTAVTNAGRAVATADAAFIHSHPTPAL